MKRQKRRRRGDRRDARWVREAPGLQTCMAHLFPNRTDNEVYLHDTIDCTDVLKYIEEKNKLHTEYKTTLFHCFITALSRICMERPLMNRFVQGHRIYERNEISLSFVCKRRFKDDAEEALLTVKPKKNQSLDDISHLIYGDITKTRKSETATGGVDAELEWFGKLPRLLLMVIVKIVRWLDFWGRVPYALIKDDPDYSTMMVSNLGSIGCDAVYHHLNNYGSTSIVVTIGKMRREMIVDEQGNQEVRVLVDIGATLDERIGDGFYFARSLKLIKYLFSNPELLDRPLGESIGYDYES